MKNIYLKISVFVVLILSAILLYNTLNKKSNPKENLLIEVENQLKK